MATFVSIPQEFSSNGGYTCHRDEHLWFSSVKQRERQTFSENGGRTSKIKYFIGVHILGEIQPAGGLIPWPNRDGRTELDCLSRSKNSTIPQSTVGGLFMFGESAGGQNGGPVCGDGN